MKKKALGNNNNNNNNMHLRNCYRSWMNATLRWHICYARQKCDLFSADLLQARADLLQARQICCGSGRIVAGTQMTCASVLKGPTKWLGGS